MLRKGAVSVVELDWVCWGACVPTDWERVLGMWQAPFPDSHHQGDVKSRHSNMPEGGTQVLDQIVFLANNAADSIMNAGLPAEKCGEGGLMCLPAACRVQVGCGVGGGVNLLMEMLKRHSATQVMPFSRDHVGQGLKVEDFNKGSAEMTEKHVL